MSMDEMGPISTTMYNVILVALDLIQIVTLTLYVPEEIIIPKKLINVSFLKIYNHFVSICIYY